MALDCAQPALDIAKCGRRQAQPCQRQNVRAVLLSGPSYASPHGSHFECCFRQGDAGRFGANMIDVEGLLAAVSTDQPCGPNLEYDKAFGELERIAQFKPEQQMGDTVVAAEAPDWRQVEKQATQLLASTKDLRVALHLVKAALNNDGFVGFAGGLAVFRGLVERYWDAVHPQLDPDDDNDPTMRINILAELCDSATVLHWVRTAPLVSARALGRFCLRDVAIAAGEQPPSGGEDAKPAEMSTIEAAFSAADLAELQATADSAREACKHVADIESLVTGYVGAGNAANLSKVRDVLQQAAKVVDKYLVQRGVGVPAGDGGASAEGGAQSSGQATGQRLTGEIGTREDVVRAIDKICDYYSRHEPSSPIPILMRRCKRLINKDFLDIMRDLAPDGLAQVEVIRGRTEEDGST
jgi:type VI secretion system protein ImpA